MGHIFHDFLEKTLIEKSPYIEFSMNLANVSRPDMGVYFPIQEGERVNAI